ncbi:flavin reductase family protein [Acrocarpospora macrocephala]|uniref:Monooxygenase n=1 Tax=Acrocarpospora macrocephala TaxID=150177 RepID=A0A5M3WU29_9ACTN|nr:flavin reductase family protein [Acrocarpospora macrocephala]GES09648.1 monooxygenase [Acrocarpospora macrocephala]
MNPTSMRVALSHFGSGLTVITGMTEEGPVGFTCQSFSSLSLDPPLVTFSPSRSSTTWPRIRPLDTFAINVLADGQTALSVSFSRSGSDKFSGVEWRPSQHGAPLIGGALVTFDCRIWGEYDGGDHTIVAAEVVAIELDAETKRGPLLYYKSTYASLNLITENAAVPVSP